VRARAGTRALTSAQCCSRCENQGNTALLVNKVGSRTAGDDVGATCLGPHLVVHIQPIRCGRTSATDACAQLQQSPSAATGGALCRLSVCSLSVQWAGARMPVGRPKTRQRALAWQGSLPSGSRAPMRAGMLPPVEHSQSPQSARRAHQRQAGTVAHHWITRRHQPASLAAQGQAQCHCQGSSAAQCH
jgi:hypothetical protein